MAVGVSNQVVSTEDLEQGMSVLVDHEPYDVGTMYRKSNGDTIVALIPAYGPVWNLEVGSEDYTEPMWELAN